MKFSCCRTDLLNAVNIVERAVASKSTMNILEGIFIEAKENTIRFLGNNLELCIDCSIPGSVETKGCCVVKANLFSDAVKKLPSYVDDVQIEVNESNSIFLSCGNAKFNFSTASADEFPRPQELHALNEISISEQVLKNMIRQTVYAVSQNDTKPYLTGILFDIKDGFVNVVGCDGYRLAIRREATSHAGGLKFIMQGKTARELLSLLGETDYEVKIKVNEKQAQLTLKNCVVTTRLIDGDYLNYEGVAKHENTLFVVTETRDILDSVDRASLIASEAVKAHVLLQIKDGQVHINCETVLGQVKDKFEVNMQGEPIEIAFNPRYLLEAFKNTETKEIKMSFSTALNPVVIQPIEGESFRYIVLPVRLH
ncbi:MAG: DNA polymerase III subunit beta [Ruminococcaceae bacterium]|nr:DNA polymerase III subunit beta [Oscillospiraceae bacterium]